MNDIEEILQERIERLERGEAVEVCLAGLPEAEARALRLIADIRALALVDAEVASIADQRALVLGTAVTRLKPTAIPPTTAPPLLGQLQGWLDRLLSRRELAAGLAIVLIVALLSVVWLGLSRGQTGNDAEAVITAPGEQPGETIAAEIPPTAPVETGAAEELPLGEGVADTAVSATAVTDVTATNAVTAYLPILSTSLNLNAQTAAVEVVAGLVEIQGADGAWTAVNKLSTVTAGQRLRTGSLSQATLTFYDGSQAHLHAHTELSINELNAQRPADGFRTVILTQHVGESDHDVEFRNDGGSRYEVNTPAGSGIARGTKFQVLVTPGLLAQFAVTEGKVDVTGLSQTVSVIAGQTTAVLAGSPPQTPNFRITGEGEVSQIGAVWIIAGQTFQTHNQTIIIGNPQVGDLVYVAGRLLADGSRMADRIILLRPTLNNRFTLTGPVEGISAATWTVAGQTILVNEATQIDDDIEVGNRVRVSGIILLGGGLQAREIEKLDDQPGFPFRFTGVVEAIGAESWTISGVTIAITATTTIDDDIVVGDVVEARGWIQEDGAWLARRIRRVEDDVPTFTVAGRVQSIDPWQVAGISFETREWTAVEPGIDIGDRVRVRGVILADGTWVASTIDRLGDDDDDDTIVLIGIVNNINPWVVNGLPLLVTGDTVIIGNITVGDPVVVRIRLAADGTWQVLSIRPLHPHFGLGCFVISTLVVGVQPNQLLLQGWPAIQWGDDDDDDMQIVGNIENNGVISFPICIRIDGTIIIIGPIIVIYQPIIIIVPPPQPPPGGGGGDNRNGNDND
ncbi:MAG: FecR domain-containing protein [Anaerolineae bacterium]|nr:FecR domain-containing protein [Anaerolineae bacterium]